MGEKKEREARIFAPTSRRESQDRRKGDHLKDDEKSAFLLRALGKEIRVTHGEAVKTAEDL